MPKRDMQDIWTLLADLYRELSWLLRVGFFGGLLVGFLLATYLVMQIPTEEIRRGFLRILLLFILGVTALGGFLGLALAVTIELAHKAIFGAPRDDPRKRTKRRS